MQRELALDSEPLRLGKAARTRRPMRQRGRERGIGMVLGRAAAAARDAPLVMVIIPHFVNISK
jgi:hypothetical protein